MMPPPAKGSSRGTRRTHGDDLAHLMCPCQTRKGEPLALCGVQITRIVFDHPAPLASGPSNCLVCWDLARTALVAQRCERCAS